MLGMVDGSLKGRRELGRRVVELEKGSYSDEKEAVRNPEGRTVECVLFRAGKLAGERPEVLVG